ncbi:MAG: DNA-binding protein [Candidatus Cloacimonetes bacterium]|nr:DNA-binding protein [Candidatus Cloacimonadota bacterium]MCF7814859.1 DNA-binding protein [Candidatus Cloacimonadota bacterium]MCF7867514.1 DNA-binding protein [Candidatus Cloacimonadota bacterium]MCF7882984.1 DNA-binding protein [Candidatus Cloacimonadota bacterium]
MKSKRIGNICFIRIDKGEEIISSLKKFCENENIKLGKISGIGATNNVTVGLFEPSKQQYHSNTLKEDFEILSLTGNITTMKNEVYLHCHITLANKNHQSFGGHLNSAVVSATCEIVLEVYDGSVDRFFDQESGLNLLDI